MKCPHCSVTYNSQPANDYLGDDTSGKWSSSHEICPECGKIIVWLRCFKKQTVRGTPLGIVDYPQADKMLVYPRQSQRPPLPSEVPAEFANDYNKAALVLADSPDASAAISRRCLQYVLREKAGVKKSTLFSEIDQVTAAGNLPSHISEELHIVRTTGNFAAHAEKDIATGEIIDVEPGEAEHNLDVLDSLFDFYFVLPAKSAARKAATDAKLQSAGKPPLK